METEYLYQVDYAKSGRASCNKCRSSIDQSSLRIGRLVQAANFDGKIPKWFHFDCFFTKNTRINSTSEIKHFDTIRWDDQEKIRGKLAGAPVVEAKAPKYTIKLSSADAECTMCNMPLFQERYSVQGGSKKVEHLSCFLKSESPAYDLSTSLLSTYGQDWVLLFLLTGFKKLKQVDQQAVLLVQSSAKKQYAQQRNGKSKPTMEKKEKVDRDVNKTQDALREQSQRLWQVRDQLETQVSKDALIGLLEYNDQRVPSGLSNLLDAVADAMTFGSLPKCPDCQEGQLYYSNGSYKCANMVTTWVRCMYTTRSLPSRLPFRVPKEYHDVDLLKQYKYVKRTRLFATESLPLSGLRVVVTEGPFEGGRTREEVIMFAKKLGATVVPDVTRGVVLLGCRSTVQTLLSNSKYEKAENMGLYVVDEKPFFERLESDGAAGVQCNVTGILSKHSITPWRVIVEVEKDPTNSKRKRKHSKAFGEEDSDEAALVRMSYKGGAVVDPLSGLQDKASVLKDTKSQQPLSAVLGMVDLVKGSNSYYRLQALQSDTGPTCWLFRAWGRIGTNIGDSKLERFPTGSSARDAFERLYFEKTGNLWQDRANFEKKPNKFYEMELDYDEVEQKSKNLHQSTIQPSLLPAAVQALIEFICDVDSMRKTMIEFQLDLKKLPLGKLSKRQIHEAYSVLNNLTRMLDKRGKKSADASLDRTTLVSESTRFFTLIPHDFGMQTPPLLDTRKLVKAKLNMLEDLLEIELAYKMLKSDVDSGSGDKPINPLDRHYAQLKTSIKPLDPGSEEYARITDYVRRNHGQTHNNYTLEVQSIFEIERGEEKERFDQFATAAGHNKLLLWHGSRRTNWVGILSQGLRIAPPEAPVTGYMFGKGIYFADMVSKSANYCFTTPSQPVCLLLLCEVILGEMELCLDADATDMPSDKHSRKGVGSVTPNPTTHYTSPDGVLYPIGEPVSAGVENTSLIYNEYVVYDVDQVRQKFVVRAKFVYS